MELIYLPTILALLTVGAVFAAMWWVGRDSHSNTWQSISRAPPGLSLFAGHFVAVLAVATPCHWVDSTNVGAMLFISGASGQAGASTWLGHKVRVPSVLGLRVIGA